MASSLKIAQAIAEQGRSNRSAAGHAHHFAGHRARLTQEIGARRPAAGGGRLCLLGAGVANDVDLDALGALFAEIHLVDIDADAIQTARARARPETAAHLQLHAPCDLSGVFDRMDGWAQSPPDTAELRPLADAAVARVVAGLPGPFDLVVSCCLLTQLQLVLFQVVGEHK